MPDTSHSNSICSSIATLLMWGGALVLPLLLLILNAFFGNLNQDEGWYLYAAQQVADGLTPYKDFMFTQGPVFPYVMSLFDPVVDRFGVLGGRIVNAVFGWSSTLLAGILAANLVPKGWKKYAWAMTLILAGVNVYQSYFFSVVKTYSMATLFFNAGLICLVKASRKSSIWASALCALFLVVAAGCRLSAGLALPIAGIYLLSQHKRMGNENWVIFGITGMFALMALWVPFITMAHDVFMFGVFKYHTLREVGDASTVMMKAGFISRVVQAYFVAFLLSPLLLGCRCKKRATTPDSEVKQDQPTGLLLFIVLAITLLHLSAGFPYDDYQVFLYPALAALIAVALCNVLQKVPQYRSMLGLFLLVVCGAASFSSPINQEWFVYGRDRIWWKSKEVSDLSKLRQAATAISGIADPALPLITQDTYLAVEAGLKVPAGMEMGVFSFYPELSDLEATELRVTNEQLLSDIIQQHSNSVVALSGYSFAIAAPKIEEVNQKTLDHLTQGVVRGFDEAKRFENFGQGHTGLIIYKPKRK